MENRKISTERDEKVDNSYFKEVVSGVIKSLAQNIGSETKEVCEPPQEEINKEDTEICQDVVDQDKGKDEVEFKNSENDHQEEDIPQNNINIDKKNNLEEKTQGHVTIESIENSEKGSLEESIPQNNIKMDDQDKQEDTTQEHNCFENIEKTEVADIENEKVLENNMKINDQIK